MSHRNSRVATDGHRSRAMNTSPGVDRLPGMRAKLAALGAGVFRRSSILAPVRTPPASSTVLVGLRSRPRRRPRRGRRAGRPLARSSSGGGRGCALAARPDGGIGRRLPGLAADERPREGQPIAGRVGAGRQRPLGRRRAPALIFRPALAPLPARRQASVAPAHPDGVRESPFARPGRPTPPAAPAPASAFRRSGRSTARAARPSRAAVGGDSAGRLRRAGDRDRLGAQVAPQRPAPASAAASVNRHTIGARFRLPRGLPARRPAPARRRARPPPQPARPARAVGSTRSGYARGRRAGGVGRRRQRPRPIDKSGGRLALGQQARRRARDRAPRLRPAPSGDRRRRAPAARQPVGASASRPAGGSPARGRARRGPPVVAQRGERRARRRSPVGTWTQRRRGQAAGVTSGRVAVEAGAGRRGSGRPQRPTSGDRSARPMRRLPRRAGAPRACHSAVAQVEQPAGALPRSPAPP